MLACWNKREEDFLKGGIQMAQLTGKEPKSFAWILITVTQAAKQS